MTSQSTDTQALSIQRRPPGAVSVRTYSTRFPADEDPISEGGIWLNGRKDGLDWADIRTRDGLAHGETIALKVAERRVEQGDEIDVPVGDYNDPEAILDGAWGGTSTSRPWCSAGTRRTSTTRKSSCACAAGWFRTGSRDMRCS